MKRELGDGYQFCRFLPEKRIQKERRPCPGPQTVASLTVGCVRIESRLYPEKGSLTPVWHVFVQRDHLSYTECCFERLEGCAVGAGRREKK